MRNAHLTRGHQLVAQVARKMTAAELARRTGTSPSMLRHVAAGRKTPGADLRERLVPFGVPSEAWELPAQAPSAQKHRAHQHAPKGASTDRATQGPPQCWSAEFLAANGMTPADFLELLEALLEWKPDLATALADGFRELGEVASELAAEAPDALQAIEGEAP